MGGVELYSETPYIVERRKFPRLREHLPFALTAHSEGVAPAAIGSAIVFNTTDDISEGGLRFQYKSGFEAGTLLKVFLTIPETLQMICRIAVVRSCRQLDSGGHFSTGLSFVSGIAAADPWSAYVRAKARA